MVGMFFRKLLYRFVVIWDWVWRVVGDFGEYCLYIVFVKVGYFILKIFCIMEGVILLYIICVGIFLVILMLKIWV